MILSLLLKKIFLSFLALLFIMLIVLYFSFLFGKPLISPKIIYGVSFSKSHSESLGLDWKENYLALLKDLKVKKLRLSAYWTEIEPVQDDYSFENLDWQIAEAKKEKARIVLALGKKLPRWPECHIPDWARELSQEEGNKQLLSLVAKIIERYKDEPSIEAWQVENEPLFFFGECPEPDKELLDREIALVRSLDRRRPIITTDSGEFGSWFETAKRGDIFGSTLYRINWNKYLGYVNYKFPPIFYYRKAQLVKYLFGVSKVIIIELQAEPWGPALVSELSLEEQYKSMNPERFREHIEFARKTGFSEFYLWGVEWWYWLKTQGENDIWQEAKNLF